MKYSPSRTAAAVVERDEEDPGRFRAYFRRWHPGEGVQRRRGEHGSWYRLVPREPLTGDSSRELLHHAVSLLASVEERTCDSLFRIEIEPAPAKLPVVDDIMHARYRLHATVVQLGPDRFRIRYWGDIKGYPDEGWGFSPQLFPPGDPRREQLWDTFADSIEAARDVAAAEMENILQTTGNRFKLR